MFRKKENAKIQVLFKVYGPFSRTFHAKFGFQGLVKTAFHLQVLFKPVRTLYNITICGKSFIEWHIVRALIKQLLCFTLFVTSYLS